MQQACRRRGLSRPIAVLAAALLVAPGAALGAGEGSTRGEDGRDAGSGSSTAPAPTTDAASTAQPLPRDEAPSSAQESSTLRGIEDGLDRSFAVGIDLLVRRPMHVVGVVGGFGIFVASVPFTAIGGGWRDAWEAFVETPYGDLTEEPLGRF